MYVVKFYLIACVSGLSSLQVCFAISFCNKICFDAVCFMCLLQLLVFAAVWFVMLLKAFRSHVSDAGLWLELHWQGTCTTTILMFCIFTALAAEHPVSTLSDNVQRPISTQRSLRHGAQAITASTRASWSKAPVWGLRQKVHKIRQHVQAHENCSRCWWRQDFPMWRLL